MKMFGPNAETWKSVRVTMTKSDGTSAVTERELLPDATAFYGMIPFPTLNPDTAPIPESMTIKCPSCFVQQQLSVAALPDHGPMTIACGC